MKRRGLRIAALVAVVFAVAGLVALVASRTALPPSSARRAAWNAEIAALEAEQDSLRTRLAALAAADPRIAALPEGDVVLAIPTAFLHDVIARVFSDVASQATLELRDIHAHVAKKVRKIVTIGEFTVDVDIHRIVGRLHPGTPRIRFGGDRVSLSLPVEVRTGHGEATVHFVWDGKNVADLACGDMDVTQRVAGEVIPARYEIDGHLDLAVVGARVVGRPRFPETRLRVRVTPSKASWAAIDSILAEKHGVCGFVLDKVDVPKLLKGLVEEKGFNVKLPLHDIEPFTLPGAVSDTVRVGDRAIGLSARVESVRIDSSAVWYGARVVVAADGPPAREAIPPRRTP